MKLKNLPERIAKRLLHHAFTLFGIDPISRTKIGKRNDLIEIGTKYGGWIVPAELLNAESICYCVGCGEDISFDIGLINYFKCNVYGFDPTPRAIRHVETVAGHNPKYHFHSIGLWDKEDALKFFAPKNPAHVSHSLLNLQNTKDFITIKVNRLSALMEKFGHDRLDLLKIDIEGAEYKVIESIVEDGLDIRVICVEYDECFNPLDTAYLKFPGFAAC